MEQRLTASGTRRQNHLRAVASLGLAALVCAVFLPCLSNGFVADDMGYIVRNPAVRDFSLAGFIRLWREFYCYSYVPVTMVSFWADSYFSGRDPHLFHAVNLLLHLANAFLVWLFLSRLTGRVWPGYLAAVLFAVHPLRVEAVAWISSRKDLLCALFFLSGLVFYVLWREKGGRKMYAAACACAVLAMLAKPSGVAFPLALLCVEYLRRGRIDRALAAPLSAFLVAAAGVSAITLISQKPLIGAEPHTGLLSVLVPVRALAHYLEKTVAPVTLSAVYPTPEVSALVSRLPADALLIASLGALAFAARRRTRVAAFGLLFFLATLLPSLKIVPFAVGMAADRYTYLPSVGLMYLAAEGLFLLWRRSRAVSVALTVVTVCGWSVLSFLRCGVWKNDVTVWSDAVAHYPHAVTYTFRGLGYGGEGNYRQAVEDLTRALSLRPSPAFLVRIYADRAVAYGELGEYEKAYADYEAALRCGEHNPWSAPEVVEVYRKRGMLSYALGRHDDAIEDLSRAISLNPKDYRLFVLRGNARAANGDRRAAIADYTRTIEKLPEDPIAWYNRAAAHAALGEHAKAVADFTQAARRQPGFAAAYAGRAASRLSLGDVAGAVADVSQAESLGWVFPEAFVRQVEDRRKNAGSQR